MLQAGRFGEARRFQGEKREDFRVKIGLFGLDSAKFECDKLFRYVFRLGIAKREEFRVRFWGIFRSLAGSKREKPRRNKKFSRFLKIMLLYSHLILLLLKYRMDKLTVVKTHRLIESAYSLSLLEQQMILYSIAHGRDRDELMHGKIFTINVKDFVRQFRIKDKNVYANLKEASNMFFNRRVRVLEHREDTKTTEVTEYRWLQMHSYNDGEGTISIQFTDEVLKHITRIDGKLQKYTEYGFLNVTGLKSPYSIRMYELLRKNSFTGKYLVDVDWIREHFDIGDKYERVRDITRYVVEKTLEEINEKSDINASVECIRAGRVVTQYLFTIRFIDRLDTPGISKKFVDDGKKQTSLFPEAEVGESEAAYQRRIREFQKLARKRK